MRWLDRPGKGETIFKIIFSIPVVIAVLLIACAVYLTPYIFTAFEGAVDRFDFMIGYEVGDP